MGLAAGRRLGPYEILAPLGAGGMGEVYRARDTRLDRPVAVKVLPEAATADPQRRRRFELEAGAAGALNHPNILAVHDVGLEHGVSFLVMELLEGRTLTGCLHGLPLPVSTALDLHAAAIVRRVEGIAVADGEGLGRHEVDERPLRIHRARRSELHEDRVPVRPRQGRRLRLVNLPAADEGRVPAVHASALRSSSRRP